ncbi:aldehyde dehydrogenase family protein [Streptomyces sp. NPDC004959]|uniref:aldehyde dehydrogenase family protein n=1 Tax=unclassified Streptomyces TaxID=2593676 RepID=UPI0004C6A5F3|nr:aldehyde dehydrogenase family protein [Streptomyces sp. NRRL F-5630]
MTYRSVNPYTEELVAEYAEHTDAQLEEVLTRADETFRVWGRASFGERGKVLSAAADLLHERREELARLATTEMGKRYVELLWEIDLCVPILRYYAAEAERILARKDIAVADGTARVDPTPLGVIFAIEPWNFPYFQLLRIAAPVLMAGNTVVMKHAPSVPGCALAVEKIFLDAGAPEGLYSNVFLTNEQSAGVIADRRIKGIALTGSERAGSAVAAAAGRALKKVTLELGGSDPFLVLDDADLDLAVPLAVAARTMNTGQACASAKRFIVHSSHYDAFLERFTAAFAAMKPGDPMDEATDFGPLVGEEALDRALKQIELAREHGATVAVGGRRIDRTGYFLEPTVLTGVTPDNPIFRQEIFAQVAMVFRVDSEEEAVALANDSDFGLGSTVVSTDVARAERVAAQLEVGMVFVNRAGDAGPALPWGGVKNSGYGRGLSDFGITEFVNWKLVRIA